MDNLPLETLIKIFSYLVENKDLERAAIVSKKWREAIMNSPELMNHMSRRFFGRNLNSKRMIFRLPYKNLLIESSDFQIYLPLSSNFSNLRQISIFETAIKFKKSKDCLQLPMPHLKILKLDECTEDFLSIIYCENVEHFNFRYDHYGENPFDETLKQFFALNCNLKRLHIEVRFPRFNMSRYKFKLQSLIIDEAYDLPSHFIEFLSAQKSSLEELILRVFRVEDPVLNYIYFDMHLTKLLDNHWSRVELERKVNESIKSLIISNSMLIPRDALLIQQIILSCHALDFLRIELSQLRPRQTLQFLTPLMPRLKTVAVSIESIKHLKLIRKWIRLNGYHLSLSSTCGYYGYTEKIVNGFSSGSESSFEDGIILIISSEKSSKKFNQYGKVITVNAFHQISQDVLGGAVELKNLTMHKQDKKVKKSLQIRIFIEQVIVPFWNDENSIFLKFTDDFNNFEHELDD